jgi:YjbE family integral membrane protein
MSPDLFTAAWWSALGTIIVIDLVLAGDNAIVIGLAARDVPKAQQRKVVLWGTAGAILVRVALTGAVVYLLKIPGFLLAGGLALVWIAWKLTQSGDGAGPHVKAEQSMGAAIRTIVIADAVMGVDNVLAVGGAAHGSVVLVIIGLAVSVPIVVWGSTLVLKWVERFPQIMWIGAAVLGWTASKMIAGEPLLAPTLVAYPWLRTVLSVVIVAGLVALPIWRALNPHRRAQLAVVLLLGAWLVFWGYAEEQLGMLFDPRNEWQWDNIVLEIVRWIGWIPVALLVHRRVRSAASSA